MSFRFLTIDSSTRIFLVLLLMGLGCNSGQPERTSTGPAETDDQRELDPVSEWRELAKHPAYNEQNPRVMELAAAIASIQPDRLHELISFLAEPETSPLQRVFTVRSLYRFVRAEHVPQLSELYRAQENSMIQASAITLLGYTGDTEAAPMLLSALEHSDRRITFAARLSLGRLEVDEYRARLLESYWDDDTTPAERIEILRFVLDTVDVDDTEILLAAVASEETLTEQRIKVATTLGLWGGAEAIPAIEKGMTVSENPVFIEIAKAAISTIRERQE